MLLLEREVNIFYFGFFVLCLVLVLELGPHVAQAGLGLASQQRMTDFELMPLLLPSYRWDLWSSNCPLCLVLVCLFTSGVDGVAPEGTTDIAVFPVTCEADTLYYVREQAVKQLGLLGTGDPSPGLQAYSVTVGLAHNVCMPSFMLQIRQMFCFSGFVTFKELSLILRIFCVPQHNFDKLLFFKTSFPFSYISLCVRAHGTHAMGSVWRPESHFVELILFYLHMVPGMEVRLPSLHGKCFVH